MKKLIFKRYFKKSLEYIALLPLCCLIGILLLAVLLIISRMITANLLIQRITEFLLGLILVCLPMFLVTYRDSYHNKRWNLKEVLVALTVMVILQQIVAPFLQYVPYIAGPTYVLSKIVYFGSEAVYTNFSDIKDPIPYGIQHLCMTGITVFAFVPSIILGEYVGFKKRLKHEKQLVQAVKENEN